ncbi:MAG: PAS domain S-box protein [Bacteroidota bacterium]|nr:PAS domain S-box protein [Bacteroidota bacterium]
MNILIVEQTVGDAGAIKTLLLQKAAANDWALFHAETLSIALERLTNDAVDVVLLDAVLPGTTSLEAFTRIQMSVPEIPVILVGEKDDQAMAGEALRQGAQQFLVKGPLDEQRLVQMIRSSVQRKRTGEALRNSEEQYRHLFLDNPHPMWVYDMETFAFLAVNDAAVRHYGYSREEFLSMTIKNIRPSEDVPKLVESVRQSDGYKQSGIWRHRKKDGTLIDVEITSHTSVFAGKRADVVLINDVTERRKAEHTTQELAAIVESASDAIISTMPDGSVVSWNSAAEQMFGYTREEMVGRSASVLALPEHRKSIGRHVERMREGKGNEQYETVFVRKGGEKIPVSLVISPMKDDRGSVSGISLIVRDITERKKAEKALEELAEKEVLQGRRKIYLDFAVIATLGICVSLLAVYFNGFEILTKWVMQYREFRIDELFVTISFLGIAFAVFAFRRWKEDQREIRGHKKVVDVLKTLHDGLEVRIQERTAELRVSNEELRSEVELRKQAESSLKASEEHYRGLVENMTEIYYVVDGKGKITYGSPTLFVQSGYSKEELIGKLYARLITQDDRGRVVKLYQHHTVQGTRDLQCTFRARRKDGSTMWVEQSTHFVRDGNGSVLSYQNVTRDITGRKKAEEELQRSEEMYRTLAEAAHDMIFVVGHDLRVQYANSYAAKQFRATMETIIGKQLRELFPGEPSVQMEKNLDYIFENGIPLYRENLTRFINTDFWIGTWLVPIKDGAGKITAILGVSRDITGQKKAAEQITMLAHAVKSITECVSITDMNDTILFVNESFLKTYGYSEEELLGKHIGIVRSPNSPPEVTQEILPATLSGGWRGELINRKKEGTEFPIFLSTSVVYDEAGEPIAVVGVATDTTERNEIMKRQENLKLQLYQAQKLESIGTLASGIAHDFNNILGIILGHASLLERVPDNLQMLKSVQSIVTATERGAKLVKQLLTFAKKTETFIGHVHLDEIVLELVKLMNETFPKTITVTMTFIDKPSVILGDTTQIHQVFLNLCVNARDAMPQGGTLSITTSNISLTTAKKKFPAAHAREYVRVVVSDTGTGMDEKTQRRIFEPFFTTKEPGKGTGLGMAVVYGIIESHHGLIGVESERGKGTTFTILLPAMEGTAAEEKVIEAQAEIAGGTETVMIVEDEELLRSLLRIGMEQKGYAIVEATNGEEAFTIYKRRYREIALVLSDVGLPEKTGDALFLALKEINPAVKMILASGFMEPNDKSEILKAGVKEFVQKPYELSVVFRVVREVLDMKGG